MHLCFGRLLRLCFPLTRTSCPPAEADPRLSAGPRPGSARWTPGKNCPKPLKMQRLRAVFAVSGWVSTPVPAWKWR